MKVIAFLSTALFFGLAQAKKVASNVRRVSNDDGLQPPFPFPCLKIPVLFFNSDLADYSYNSLTNFGFLDVPFYLPFGISSQPAGFLTLDAQKQEGSLFFESWPLIGDCVASATLTLTTPLVPGPPLANSITLSGSCQSPLVAITGGTFFASGLSGFMTLPHDLNGRQSATFFYICDGDFIGLQAELGTDDVPLLFEQSSFEFGSSEGLAEYSGVTGLGDYLSGFSSVAELVANSTTLFDAFMSLV